MILGGGRKAEGGGLFHVKQENGDRGQGTWDEGRGTLSS
jgi:hypothetical protein